jgi:hypothetical protein
MVRFAIRLLLALLVLSLLARAAHPLLHRAEAWPQPLSEVAHALNSLAGAAHARLPGTETSARTAPACRRRGALPDPRCTPGAVVAAALSTVCAPGYTERVRPVPDALRRRVYESYGIARHAPREYEIDHLVPLDIGGSNAQRNLWPQPGPAYHAKDRVEATLGHAVCEHRVPLRAAQRAIATNWQSAPARLHLIEP